MENKLRRIMLKKMKNDILDLVNNRPGTSFVEIKRFIEGSKGDASMTYPDKNIFVHGGLSEDVCKSIKELIDDGLLVLTPSSPIIYMIDGEVYKMPIVKSFRSYKQERWMPAVLNIPKNKKS